MHWSSLGEFLAMGGHAAYVWPAFGLALLVLVGLLVISLRELRAAEAELAAAEMAANGAGRRRRDRKTGTGTT